MDINFASTFLALALYAMMFVYLISAVSIIVVNFASSFLVLAVYIMMVVNLMTRSYIQ